MMNGRRLSLDTSKNSRHRGGLFEILNVSWETASGGCFHARPIFHFFSNDKRSFFNEKEDERMSRAEELRSILEKIEDDQKIVVRRLVDELIFIEERMDEVKKLPFIRFNPEKPEQQKPTVASKQYKELSQSYMNGIRILSSLLRKEEGVEDDPVEKFLREYGVKES